MVLASWILKRQLMRACAWFRSSSRAWTSRQRDASSGRRCLRQLRENMLNSISAIPSTSSGQDSANCHACGVVKLQPLGDAPGLRGRKGLVQRRRAMRVQVVEHQADYRDIGVGIFPASGRVHMSRTYSGHGRMGTARRRWEMDTTGGSLGGPHRSGPASQPWRGWKASPASALLIAFAR